MKGKTDLLGCFSPLKKPQNNKTQTNPQNHKLLFYFGATSVWHSQCPALPAKYFRLHNSKKMIPCYRHCPKAVLNRRGLNVLSLLNSAVHFFEPIIHGLSILKRAATHSYPAPAANLGHLIAAVFNKWCPTGTGGCAAQLKAALKRLFFSHMYKCYWWMCFCTKWERGTDAAKRKQ